MPEVRYTTVLGAALEPVWEYVRVMGNWAPFVTGYQSHEEQSDTESVWTVRGDVGMLSREVRLQVQISEWLDGERVCFQIKGQNEAVHGRGQFEIRDLSKEGVIATVPKKRFFLFLWLDSVFAFFYRRKHGGVSRTSPSAGQQGRTELSFTLEMVAEGPMGPMVNVMIGPLLRPAAKDLADRIAAAQLLLQLGDPSAIDPLGKAVVNDPDAEAAAWASQALIRLDGDGAREALQNALENSPHEAVKVNSLWGLCRHEGPARDGRHDRIVE